MPQSSDGRYASGFFVRLPTVAVACGLAALADVAAAAGPPPLQTIGEVIEGAGDQPTHIFFIHGITTNIPVHNAIHWFGLIEDPGAAHTGYFKNRTVLTTMFGEPGGAQRPTDAPLEMCS